MIQDVDLGLLAPVLLLAAGALLVLLGEAFVPHARLLPGAVAGGAVAAAALAHGVLAADVLSAGVARATFCVPSDGPCSYVLDAPAVLLGGVVLLAGGAAILIALPEVASTRLPAGEFGFLLLVTLAGAVALPAARDLVTLVVCLETVSLPLFALVALRRRDGRATEAALTMFLVSVASTAVMLYGIALVYGLAGSMFLDRIAAALDPVTAPAAASVGIVLVLVGFAFKIAAVPFHAWAPDTYVGAPVAVAAVLAVVSKVAGFAGLVVVLVHGFGPFAPVWGPLVAVLAAASMTVGNLVALRQRSALRLLAWSSIAQAGYVLAPLAVLGSGRPGLVGAALAYLAVYSVVTTGAFAVVAVVGRTGPAGSSDGSSDSGGTDLDGYRGLARRRPVVGIAFAFFLACLAGLPPGLAGLFAKVVVVRAVVDGGYGWLAVLVVLNTVLGLAYYLSWAARVFAAPDLATVAVIQPGPARLRPATAVAIGLTAAVAVVLSVAPQLVLSGWAPAGL